MTHDDNAFGGNENEEPQSIEDWKILFERVGLGHRWSILEPLLRHHVSIIPDDVGDSEIPVGKSKLGGRADLPPEQEWFKDSLGRHLSFLAQVNCSDASAFDLSGLLPNTGILYFFYTAYQDAAGYDPLDKDKFRVFYYPGSEADLVRRNTPMDVPDEAIFTSCGITFSSAVSAPDFDREELIGVLTLEECSRYPDTMSVFENTKLLGYADAFGNKMESTCQLVSNGINCADGSGYNLKEADSLYEDQYDWILLFQLDSVSEAEMMWGDSGTLYFWIRKDDLANKRFEKCWMILQDFS